MEFWNVLVVEDSESAIASIQQQMQNLLTYKMVVCKTLIEAANSLKQQSFDIIFLDVELANNENALELLAIFPLEVPVVIVSNHIHYAIDTYEFENIVDFIPKPITKKRFLRAVKRALKISLTDHTIAEKNSIYFKQGRQMSRFSIDEIYFIKAYGIYAKVYLEKSMALINESFMTLEEVLPSQNFKRVHKSYIMNIKKISGFNSKYFFLDTHKVPIGPAFKKEFDSLLRYINVTSLPKSE